MERLEEVKKIILSYVGKIVFAIIAGILIISIYTNLMSSSNNFITRIINLNL